jgi:imidazole glycerol-phosphate synthase subunit HisH
MIAIISYGSGNLAAISNIYTQLRIEHVIATDSAAIVTADRYILPGVGHFGRTMETIRDSGLVDALHEQVVVKGKPLLGICVGMQLLADFGEEGDCAGLGWVHGTVRRFAPESVPGGRLPHMGWNSIVVRNDPLGIFRNIEAQTGFYFLHSFYFDPEAPVSVVAETEYGKQVACSVSNGRNIFGVQFHPEKSHRNGVEIFKNFAALCRC